MAKKRQNETAPVHWPTVPEDKRRDIRAALLRWYARHRRDLPWRRRENDGYAQLLAELMLQQTQVSTVIDYYRRFLERFPTVEALAAADIDDVLALWSGLGYYSRARNLHAAARRIVEEHGGCVPGDLDALMRLPGVGRYTAGAVASIAHGTRAAVLDGNVSRVLMRLLAIEADPKLPSLVKHLWQVAEALLPKRRVGDFNQALMELGATCCTPKQPRCGACPVRRFCEAFASCRVERIPPPKQRAAVLAATTVVVAVRRGPHLLFTQRPEQGLWAGLWELPSESAVNGEPVEAVLGRLRRRLPRGCRVGRTPLGTTTRQLTHRRITFHVYAGTAQENTPAELGARPARWLTGNELAGYGISRACEAVLELLDQRTT